MQEIYDRIGSIELFTTFCSSTLPVWEEALIVMSSNTRKQLNFGIWE